ncbi:MAG: nucleoside triphosphate pyrophosphohydrolase family protein [Candidatus Saccharibacteria bacterium]|nr:nucleoside triphosphate pyrophosphohydrolase family protein [Candidatus Saccharibacteria bacterium]
MDLDEYQKRIVEFDLFEATTDLKAPGFLEKVLGLVGEAGETADKIKKIIRDKDGRIDEYDIDALKKELGDTLWYLASMARYLEIPLSEVAKANVEKLSSRKNRNKLHGEGDER